jgi:hypothetical protein
LPVPISLRGFARLTRVVAVVSAVALVAAIAGCGGGGGGSPTQILRDTFGSNKPIHSGRLGFSLGIDAQGLKSLRGPVTLKLEGPFQGRGAKKVPKFNFTLSVAASGASFTAGAVSTGDKAFLTFAGSNYVLPDNLFSTFQQSFTQSQSKSGGKGSSLSALGIDPMHWLVDPRDAGTQSVGGTDTTHITAGIAVPKLLDDVNTLLGKAGQLGAGNVPNVPSSLTAKQRETVQRSVKEASVDIYTGKDDRTLRRLTVTVKLDVPAELRSSAGGLSRGTVALDLIFNELNKSQTITAPSGAKPLSDLTSALGGLKLPGTGGSSGAGGGGAPGGSSSGGSGGGGSGAPSTGAQQKYLQCLQQAGQDIAAVQKCASLLSQ